jgi:hypothetical protein
MAAKNIACVAVMKLGLDFFASGQMSRGISGISAGCYGTGTWRRKYEKGEEETWKM